MYRIDVTNREGELVNQINNIPRQEDAWELFDKEISKSAKGYTVMLFDISRGYDDLVDSHLR